MHISSFIEELKYLGHFIIEDLSDTEDFQQEARSLYSKVNMFMKKLYFSFVEVKCCVFGTFCFSLYSSSLWARFRSCDLKRLEVCYKIIFRASWTK